MRPVVSLPPGTGVLLICHGGIESIDDLPAFLRNIRHGRPPSEKLLEDMTRRYQAIGGSPFMRISYEQAQALEARLHGPVRLAGRLFRPYPQSGLQELRDLGVKNVVSLPLAPQSVHIYHAAVIEAAADLDLNILLTDPWGLESLLIEAFVEAIVEAANRFENVPRSDLAVVLSAHSLPMRVLASGDPYERAFRAMADAVTQSLAASDFDAKNIRVAFQSQGLEGGEWLGPTLHEVLAALRKTGATQLLVAPIGFVTEHIETLYDIDIELKKTASTMGFACMHRMPPMNTRPRFVDALACVVRGVLV